MHVVRQIIGARCQALDEHLFFRQLAADFPLSQTVAFVGQVAHFVLSFQDFIGIVGERAGPTDLGRVLRTHCAEEIGHEQWYLADVERLTGTCPDLRALFSPEHAPTRRAVHELAAQLLGCRDDIERLCFVLTLEDLGAASLRAVEAYFQRMVVGAELSYFGGPHVEAEKQHWVYGESFDELLRTITLDGEATERAVRVVENTYDAFCGMLDGLARTVAARGRGAA